MRKDILNFLWGTSFGVCLVSLQKPSWIFPLIIGILILVSFIINLKQK
jgi:hypothetical protein